MPAPIPENGVINAGTSSLLTQSFYEVNPNFREPYVESWNFAIQRALPGNFTLDVAYVGNHGVDQPATYNLNASTTLGADINGQPLYVLFGKKAGVDLRYVGYSSSYNALQVKFDKRYSNCFRA